MWHEAMKGLEGQRVDIMFGIAAMVYSLRNNMALTHSRSGHADTPVCSSSSLFF